MAGAGVKLPNENVRFGNNYDGLAVRPLNDVLIGYEFACTLNTYNEHS